MTPAEDERLTRLEEKIDEVHEFERLQITLLGEIVKCMEAGREHDRLGERLDGVERRLGLERPSGTRSASTGPGLHLVR